ncbi:MAG: VWA domain-containing protein [Sedimentisphaerales bacterium]|nr:VWA domain-containing protein [Sedimentisphaerales bacterium]
MKYLNMANRIQSNNKPETLLTMIDLSGSMYTDDIKPNRMEAAIMANNEIVKVKKRSYPDDKIGIISFQTTAKFSLIPTHSKDIYNFNEVINDTGLEGGTDFTTPLELAHNYFSGKTVNPGNSSIKKILSSIFFEQSIVKYSPIRNENDNSIKRIILLTDGEHLGKGNPVKIADKLKGIGATIDCIGIGGSPMDVDEELLKQIASRNQDGSIRYSFIGDREHLLRKYSSLAHHLRTV